MSKNNNIKDFTNKIIESPGGIYGELTKQMLNSHDQSDFNKYLKTNLQKLKDRGIVSLEEENQITKIIDIITSTKEFNEKAEEVISLYKQIMDNTQSGKMVRLVSCIAADSAKNKYQRPRTTQMIENNTIEYAFGINVSGALVGAVIGSNDCGIEGAIFGALIGATVSSVTI